MLYIKLITRNMRRSIKNYSIFMITMCICMMLLYAFNCIMYSEEIRNLMSHADSVMQMMTAVSLLLVGVMAWLIYYISNMMLKTRSKEFGLYLLSGMRRKRVANMFVLEMFAMGFIAFLIGCALGVFFYQLLQAIIMNIFANDYHFSLHVIPETLYITLLYFVCMWLITILKEHRALMKINIKDLLYQNEQLETITYHKGFTIIQIIIFMISMVSGLYYFHTGIVGLVMNTNNQAGVTVMLGFVILIFSIYCFYFGLSNSLSAFINKHKHIKFHSSTLLLYGHMKFRIRSNRILLATLSLLTIFTLILTTFTIKYKDLSDMSVAVACPFDVSIQQFSDDEIDVEAVRSLLNKEGYQFQDHQFHTYELEHLKNNFKEVFIDSPVYKYYKPVFLKESDYQKLLQLKHKPLSKPLKKNTYMLITGIDHIDAIKDFEKNFYMEYKRQPFTLAAIINENLGQIYEEMYIVVQDDVLQQAITNPLQYVAETKQETRIGLRDSLSKIVLKEGGAVSFTTRADYIRNSLTSYVTLFFSLLYISFVFLCVQATIMATQQMIDCSKNTYIYDIIKKLGMREKECNRLLFKQIGLYFLVPLILPFIYIIPLLQSIDFMFQNVYSQLNIYYVFSITLLLYLIVYCCYFFLAYIGCKRNMKNTLTF